MLRLHPEDRDRAETGYDRADGRQGDLDPEVVAAMLFHPSVQGALVAYGIGVALAGGLTFVMGVCDP